MLVEESGTGTKMRLGDMLVARGHLTQHRLDQALAEHQASGRRLGEVLMTRGWVSPMQLYEVLATQMGLDSADLDSKPPKPVYAKLIPESVARRLRALPIGDHGHQLVVAMLDPLDVRAIDDLQTITGRHIRPMLANPEQLERSINDIWVRGLEAPEQDPTEGRSSPSDDAPHPVEHYEANEDEHKLHAQVNDKGVVEFVETVLRKGIDRKASDIHLEAQADGLRVRFRLDGVLQEVTRAPFDNIAPTVSRLKVMSDMDITNRRSPQDGRITLEVEGREVSLRAVSIPTVHGESLVLRILDSGGGSMPELDDIGMNQRALKLFRDAINSPNGGVLVTGPTGSGKTTTLYSGLAAINTPDTSIVTVEDPVEYRLDDIKQIQINNKAGMTFASALKAILRADPDVVLVGEIRDVETARLAAEASLTGHLVLSTLHTNSAAATPVRLIEMGVEPFLVTAGITCVVAQRLGRRLCEHCRIEYEPTPEHLDAAGWPKGWDASDGTWYEAGSCRRCAGSGYSGRFGIHEVMPISDAVARLILDRAPTADLAAAAAREGMLSLRQDALYKASKGFTTLQEVSRVTSD